jgi:hypothetical protein
MTNNLLRKWADEVEHSKQDWDTAREQVFQRLGIPADIGLRLMGFGIEKLYYDFENWIRLVPGNAVRRLRTENELSKAILEIALETYETIQATPGYCTSIPSDDTADFSEPSTDFGYDRSELGRVASVASRIIYYYSGNINLNRVTEIRAEHDCEQSAYDVKTAVMISRPNERNFENIAILILDSGLDFFGDTWGESTLMFDKLIRAGVEPAHVFDDVAFDWEGHSWGGGKSDPPSGPLSFKSTDWKNRVDFSTISNPEDVFSGCWGNLSEMYENSDRFDRTESYHVLVQWHLTLGV